MGTLLQKSYDERQIGMDIPKADTGNRFRVADSELPKSSLEFEEKMMIEPVSSSFHKIDAKFLEL